MLAHLEENFPKVQNLFKACLKQLTINANILKSLEGNRINNDFQLLKKIIRVDANFNNKNPFIRRNK